MTAIVYHMHDKAQGYIIKKSLNHLGLRDFSQCKEVFLWSLDQDFPVPFPAFGMFDESHNCGYAVLYQWKGKELNSTNKKYA